MRYSKEVKTYIYANAAGTRVADLVTKTNAKYGTEFTTIKMRSFLKNNKLRTGMPGGPKKGEGTRLYPDKIKKYILKNYRGCAGTEMAAKLNSKFGRSYTGRQISIYYKNNKLNSGLTGRFQEGHEPWNKGKNIGGGPEHTLFKKGHRPHNALKIGDEVINTDGYWVRKIAEPNEWRPIHRIKWEDAHGPIPAGNKIIFGDGNKNNLALENLIMVTSGQLAVLNNKKLIQSDADLTRTGILIADVYKRAAVRKRNHKKEKGLAYEK